MRGDHCLLVGRMAFLMYSNLLLAGSVWLYWKYFVTNQKTAFFVSANHRAQKVPGERESPLLRRAALKILGLIAFTVNYIP